MLLSDIIEPSNVGNKMDATTIKIGIRERIVPIIPITSPPVPTVPLLFLRVEPPTLIAIIPAIREMGLKHAMSEIMPNTVATTPLL